MNAATMRAVRLTEWESDPVLTEVPVPEPRGSEVLVEVGAAGLCRSDIHIMGSAPGAYPYELPFTLGHETAGRVAALGPGASGVEVGDRVVVYSRWGCGTCWQCANGRDNACAHTSRGPHGGGLGRDGGLAEYLIVPSARYLVPAAGLDPVAAAPLSDAALTSYHAAKLSLAQLRPGTTAVVLGVGGLGHLAIQILKAISPVRIVAVDVRERRAGVGAERGRRRGAVRRRPHSGGGASRDRPRGSDRRARLRRQRCDACAGRRVDRSGRRRHVRRPGWGRAPSGAGTDSVRVHRAHADVGDGGRARRGGGAGRRRRDPFRGARCSASTRCSPPTASCGTGTCSDARSSFLTAAG